MNASPHGKECNVFLAHDQISGVGKNNVPVVCLCEQEMFPTLEDVVGRAGLQRTAGCYCIFEGLREQFGEYFGEETLA